MKMIFFSYRYSFTLIVEIFNFQYSYLSIFPGYHANVFAASLLILYCNIAPLTLSSIIFLISFYILSKRLFLKLEVLSDALKKNNALQYIFCKDLQSL